MTRDCCESSKILDFLSPVATAASHALHFLHAWGSAVSLQGRPVQVFGCQCSRVLTRWTALPRIRGGGFVATSDERRRARRKRPQASERVLQAFASENQKNSVRNFCVRPDEGNVMETQILREFSTGLVSSFLKPVLEIQVRSNRERAIRSGRVQQEAGGHLGLQRRPGLGPGPTAF